MVFVVLCHGAPEGSTGSGSGLTVPLLKVIRLQRSGIDTIKYHT